MANTNTLTELHALKVLLCDAVKHEFNFDTNNVLAEFEQLINLYITGNMFDSNIKKFVVKEKIPIIISDEYNTQLNVATAKRDTLQQLFVTIETLHIKITEAIALQNYYNPHAKTQHYYFTTPLFYYKEMTSVFKQLNALSITFHDYDNYAYSCANYAKSDMNNVILCDDVSYVEDKNINTCIIKPELVKAQNVIDTLTANQKKRNVISDALLIQFTTLINTIPLKKVSLLPQTPQTPQKIQTHTIEINNCVLRALTAADSVTQIRNLHEFANIKFFFKKSANFNAVYLYYRGAVEYLVGNDHKLYVITSARLVQGQYYNKLQHWCTTQIV